MSHHKRDRRASMAGNTGTFYAVRCGHEPGIYDRWPDVRSQIEGFARPLFRKCTTLAEAEAYLAGDEVAFAKARIGVIDTTKEIAIYTDGACAGNQGKGPGRARPTSAGVGVFFGEGDSRNISHRMTGTDCSNNKAELTAILMALETVVREHDTDDTRKIVIYSDSMYCINALVSWRHGWAKRGWRKGDGKPVLNVHIIQALAGLLDGSQLLDGRVSFTHVKAHSGIAGNEAADSLAVAANVSTGPCVCAPCRLAAASVATTRM